MALVQSLIVIILLSHQLKYFRNWLALSQTIISSDLLSIKYFKFSKTTFKSLKILKKD